MKEDTQVNSYTDSPCTEFIQHKFKVSHCAQCFKPKLAHALVTKRVSETVHLIEIQSNGDTMPGNKGKPARRKHETRTNRINGFATPSGEQLFEDGVLDRSKLAGKTRQLRRQFESRDAKVKRQQPPNKNPQNKNGAIQCQSSPHQQKETGFLIKIPVDTSIPQPNDLNSNSNHNGAINEHYQSDSDNELMSEPVSSRFWRAKWSPKPTRAMDPIPSVIPDFGASDMLDEQNDASVPVLKSMHLLSEQETEFQKIAKRLRHVDPPPDSPITERKPLKKYDPKIALSVQVKTSASQSGTLSDNDYDLSEKDKLLASKSVSVENDKMEKLVTAHPDEEDNDISQQKQKVTNNTITPEIYLKNHDLPNKSTTKPTQNPQAADYSPVKTSQLDLGAKPVTIRFLDGSVSYYDGSPKPIPRSPKSVNVNGSQEPSKTHTTNDNVKPSAAKAYFVVDISSNPPQGLSTSDRRSICGPPMPCTPAPRSRPSSQRSSQSYDSIECNDDMRQRLKEPPSKNPRRSFSLVDGMFVLDRSNSLDSALTDSTGTESDTSPVKHNSGRVKSPESKMLTDYSKRSTPPFPMLLADESYEMPTPLTKNPHDRDERRRSSGSQYKVPIFIQPQNYDNLGTVKSDSELKLNELPGKTPIRETAPEPPIRLTSQDYLIPMRDSIGSQHSADLNAAFQKKRSPESRDSGSFSSSDTENRTPTKTLQVFDTDQTQSNHEEFRSRAQSNPLHKPEPVYAKISHVNKKILLSSKQKRTAPGPPVDVYDELDGFTDTLPRSSPPPPPVSMEKRGSSNNLVVDLPPQQIQRKHVTNIYSQPPKRKQSTDACKGGNPEGPNSPQHNSDESVPVNKAQAPGVRTESLNKTSTNSSSKTNVDRPSVLSSQKRFTDTPVKTNDDRTAVITPKNTSTDSPNKTNVDRTSVISPKKISTDSPTTTHLDRLLLLNPQRKVFQTVGVQSSVAKMPTSPSHGAGTKEGTPSKGKAPVPSQIQNCLLSKTGTHSSLKNQTPVKAPGPPINRVQSTPMKKTNSPHEIEVPVQNGSACPPPLRVETPLPTAVSSNVNNRCVESSSSGSPPARTISPLPPNSPLNSRRQLALPDETITHSPALNKSKKSKLPWKWRKRKEDGSPEREFNAEPVQKWLDEIQKMQLEDNTQRHSLDRLDVINAYKGQPTALIVQSKDNPDIPVMESSVPEQADVSADDPEYPIPKPRRNSTFKRQAPRPPSGIVDAEKMVVEEVAAPLFQKSYSFSPTTRRKRKGSSGDDGNVYENVGAQRHEGAPPSKPTRRLRNRTTAFEDLPSQKRMAPKLPEMGKSPLCRKTSLSDKDIRHSSPEDEKPVPPPRSHQGDAKDATVEIPSIMPRKSALKSSEGSKKFDQDGKPRRPVRIKIPSDENSNEVRNEIETRTIYDNLEYLLTSDIKIAEKASLESFYGSEECCEPKVSSPSADATVQCSLPYSNHSNGMTSIFDTMLQMNGRTLAAIGSACNTPHGIEWWSEETRLAELIVEETEPCFCTENATFHQASHLDHPDNPVSLMIMSKPDLEVLRVAKFSKSISPHPNLFTIYHATTQTVSTRCIGSNSIISTHLSTPSESQELLDTTLVVMDKVPSTSLSSYVSHNEDLHQSQPDKYEHDTAVMVLQLCNALHHLQLHHITLQNIKLEHAVLTETIFPGSSPQLVLNYLSTELHQAQSEDSKIFTATEEQVEQRTGEFSLGILMYELLHLPNPFATKTHQITQDYSATDLPKIPEKSKHSRFLHHLATQFLIKDPSARLTANEGALALQTMLWGPQVDQLPLDVKDPRALEQALQQWLLLEQARIVNKAAEASVQIFKHRDTAFGYEDQLQCQFLSGSSVASLKEGLKLLYFAKN